jgi:cobalt-zinc-cadmium efflux system protein
VVAAIIILATGFSRADPIATLVVVALMLWAGSGLIRESGRIFLEAAPADIDPGALGAAMVARPHVAEVHDLHVWAITTGMPAASAHVLVEPRQDCHAVRADLEALLARDYGITHLTLQVDHCPDPALAPAAAPEAHPHDHEPRDHDSRRHEPRDHEPRGHDHDGDVDAHDDHDPDDAHDHQGPHEPHGPVPTAQDTEETHAPGLPHCEDSHGPAYRPTHDPGS